MTDNNDDNNNNNGEGNSNEIVVVWNERHFARGSELNATQADAEAAFRAIANEIFFGNGRSAQGMPTVEVM